MPASAVTIDRVDDRATRVQAGLVSRRPNDQSYDLALLEFDDDGGLNDPRALAAVETCITNARANPNGAVVVLFVHGWHHNAAWNREDGTGDAHFRAFRQLLSALMLREAERHFGDPDGSGRRVVGIYVGWNGDPLGSWIAKTKVLTNLTFRKQYRIAQAIGEGATLRDALRRIVAATKGPLPPGSPQAAATIPESPLVLVGHSMGALMLESAFLALLKATDDPLVHDFPGNDRIVEVRRDGQRVSFPDLLIALNSAADSTILREIRTELTAQRLTKSVQAATIGYAPPFLISATSVVDYATRFLWRAANLPHFGKRTDGHDRALLTHAFTAVPGAATCTPASSINTNQAEDFGQAWHCVRGPYDLPARRPSFAIDLPTKEREQEDDLPFARYRLSPLGDPQRAETTWVFQLPKAIVGNHNDIYNAKARELMIGLMQISGAVMSLANEWSETFEPETV